MTTTDGALDLARRIATRVAAVPGVAAVVLGGSRGRGTHDEASDIDLGLYCEPGGPDLPTLRAIAAALDDEHRPDLPTEPGGWGPWINGGAWLRVSGTPVDLLYRDLERVEAVIAGCLAGRLEVAYQPGHPHAFVSSIYAGEVATCLPLHDPAGRLSPLRTRLRPYPPALRAATIRTFGWEAGFAVASATKAAGRGDVAYVAGCVFRAVACLDQVLFAVNGEWLLNEKGAVAAADALRVRPARYRERVVAIFAALAGGPPELPGPAALAASLQEGLGQLSLLVDEVGAIAATT